MAEPRADALMADREPISGADDAWRRIGSIDNLTTITGVLWFDEAIDYGTLCARLEDRLLRFERFEQRVGGRDRVVRRPYWETVDDFDIETHVQHVALPEPQDTATFQRFVSRMMSRPLDERRPLWEAYLVDGAGTGDGNAVAFRINHSIGDGFALMYVMFGLVDNPGEIDFPMGVVPDPPSADDFTDEAAAADGGTATGTGSATGASAGEDADPAADASRGDDQSGTSFSGGGVLDSVKLAGTALKTGWNLLTQDDEIETSLRGELGTAKRAGWTDAIDLETVRAICDEHDATINDVLLGALAGAFRRLLADRGEPVDGRELRVTVPVNLRPMEQRDASLGNYFGLAFVPIPIGTPELGERIRIIHDRMSVEKAGIEAYLMYLTLSFGGHSPKPVLDWLMAQFEDRATGVVTNVPGPTDTIEFAGREVTDVMFWVPQANDQGLGISIFSYDGELRLGIAADANLLDDPDELAEAFRVEIEHLAEASDAVGDA
jgi:WS/DGAT/MGAT family acyltransferase